MRKQEKSRLLEIIDTLLCGIQEVGELIRASKGEDAAMLLADCQDAAIAVGNAIEQSEKENMDTGATETVRLLEELCELIYLCATIEEPGKTSGSESIEERYAIFNQMFDKAKSVKEAFLHGVKEKKLAVFLPYKASMWDSLESVWRAAVEDAEWISIVMPIPYFSKTPDGTLGELQYEGADFPANVPITDWQQFSLEREHPDIIFIHNPYDQFNSVTTVHPLFYSSKIRAYTEKLVYIPYFIHQNDTVSDTYCVLPGTIYADVVVLQSEKVREQYIRHFEGALPELVQKQGKKAIEDKFQAWGSPKFDAGSLKKEDMALPDSWKEFLGDGNKKVLFFNTHLSRLMKGNSEAFFRKLEWLFRLFEKREDVVLLWRPHPLSLDTAKSMNPEAVEPYLRLIGRYEQQRIGIYDDSKDLHRAVNLADAYYGDRSSVTELFRQQGKPVMIMDCGVLEE